MAPVREEPLDHIERPAPHYPGVSTLIEPDGTRHHIPREPYELHHAILVEFFTRTIS